ncbi:MAG: PTS sugar transporter subunit IIA [Pirellulaceae bacterium]
MKSSTGDWPQLIRVNEGSGVENYFDIDSLAKYLHLTPDQVRKMADRGKLPGTKVGGEWRFPRQEIFHWFEDRIGLSGESELRVVEELLERNESTEQVVDLDHLLPQELIWVSCPARTKNSVIRQVCEFAANQGYLWDAEKMATAIQNREQLHSTALDNGVALLHPRRPITGIFELPFLALAITPSGIPFGGPRGSLTDIFFLIASDNDAMHLKVLTRLSRTITMPDVVTSLRAASSAAEVKKVLVDAEELLN